MSRRDEFILILILFFSRLTEMAVIDKSNAVSLEIQDRILLHNIDLLSASDSFARFQCLSYLIRNKRFHCRSVPGSCNTDSIIGSAGICGQRRRVTRAELQGSPREFQGIAVCITAPVDVKMLEACRGEVWKQNHKHASPAVTTETRNANG